MSYSLHEQHRRSMMYLSRCRSLWTGNLWARCILDHGHKGWHLASGYNAPTGFRIVWGRGPIDSQRTKP